MSEIFFLHYGSVPVLGMDMPDNLEYENFCTVGVFRVIRVITGSKTAVQY